MSQSAFRSARPRCRVLPLVTCILFLGGCDGGESGGTADFPKMEKQSVSTQKQKKPAKGMDRVGSDSITPK